MKKRNLMIALFILIIGLIYRQELVAYLQIITDQQAVSAYLKEFGLLGPVVLSVLLIAQVFVAVIPGHALIVASGYIYGTLGLAVVIFSTVLGSQIAFWMSRRYGRQFIYRVAPPQVISQWEKTGRYQGTVFYFLTFVLPIFPSDLMCYVAGLSVISPRRFFMANLTGRTCCALFLALIGIYGLKPPVWFWVLALICITNFYSGWAIYKRKLGVRSF
jgi:uncharacterized membrane protein YdjX (TVP38/TMEM64 family)